MSAPAEDEVTLPFTPTHTGRRSRIGYLGIEGENFNDLWPLFVGVIGSVILAVLMVFTGLVAGGSLFGRIVLSATPASAAYGYLRFFVHRRPPHYRSDFWRDVVALRLERSLARGFLPVPRVVSRAGCWTDAELGAEPRRPDLGGGSP